MVTQVELCTNLKTLGMPMAYGEFKGTTENPAPPPPFITYQFAYSGDLMADNQNYTEINNFQVELYTTKKDLAREAAVQNLLKSLRLPYSKMEYWLDTENLWQIIYEIQLIGG